VHSAANSTPDSGTPQIPEAEKAGLALLRLASLQELTAALSDARTRQDVASVVLQRAVPLFDAAAGSIGAYDAATRTLSLLSSVGYDEAFVAARRSYSADEESLGSIAVNTRQPVFVEFVHDSAVSAPVLQRIIDRGFVAAAAAPLVFEGQPIGFLAFSYLHRQTFLPEERSLLGAFANQCAHALVRLRAYEAEQQARAAAEEAVKQREQFLSAAAHELKTPLTSLRGFTQLLTRRLDRGEAPSVAELNRALQVIDRQAVKLTALIERILDVSRLEAGRLALQCSKVDLAELTRGIVNGLPVQPGRSSVEISAPNQLTAWVDADRVEQVLFNLLSNAQKYSPPNRAIEVDLRQDGSDAIIRVRDFGPGFEPELLESLVHPFQQDRTDDRLNGLGLGLYISREIVQRHGGTLTAERAPGGGALLTMLLPMEKP
jgi:signal transduction histidine kinase